jgi:hypothetical protein
MPPRNYVFMPLICILTIKWKSVGGYINTYSLQSVISIGEFVLNFRHLHIFFGSEEYNISDNSAVEK